MDYDSQENDAGTNAEQSETDGDFRVSYESESVVYFVGAENGLVKIGFAKDFYGRLGKLCCGSPMHILPLAITYGGMVEERAYHHRFKPWRSHGEWFYLTDEMEEEIDRINYEQSKRCVPIRFRDMALPLTLTRSRRDLP